ncbi:MAG: glycosyltransferase [Infirmifilum sp.]
MRIGVIIPSFRSNPKIINQILFNINRAFMNIGIKADLLLIDFGSSEDLYKNITNIGGYLNNLNLRVKKLAKDRGLLYMRQIGAKSLTHCDYILFVDNDVIPHVDVIIQAIKLAETDARIGAVTAILKGSPIPYFDISFFPISFRDYPQRPLLILNPIGGFFLLSKRALKALFLTRPHEIQFWYEDVS